ncbi:platelet glycoprotein V-like isoform X1 [Cydia fagiglandana]|uniref:platelet glycoprotein V-like isoform X1 n=1 Tax=Cydia fagiglandana TaxID=1458189 RepID=UPI002FEDF620
MNLNINSKYAKTLTISLSTTRPQNSQWFSTDDLQEIKSKYQARSNNWLTAAANEISKNSLEHLTLRGIPVTTDQFISIHNIKSLTLVDTGLEEVMDLSEFSNLTRLELREPYLLNAEKLSATSIEELVLHAPDAGLAAMSHLRNATFIEVYMMGRLFGNCSNLKHLALINGTLSALPDHWLVGCSALRSLKLPDDLLADTTELRHLDLSHNSLGTLPEGLLDNTRGLEYLDVSDNHLKSLPAKLPVFLKKVYACGNDHFPMTSQNLKVLEDWGCIVQS